MVQIEMEEVEPIGMLRALATQSDLNARLCRETWYGHHAPCCRLFLFLLLSTVTLAFGALVDLQALNVPIAGILTTAEVHTLMQSHKDCFWEVCEAARGIPLDCIVNADGTSVRTDFDTYEGPYSVPMPQQCNKALEETLGEQIYTDWMDESNGGLGGKMQLVAIDNGDGVTAAVVTVNSRCSFKVLHHVLAPDNINNDGSPERELPLFSASDIAEGPGQRFGDVLSKNVCENFLPGMEVVHSVLMAFRYVTIVIGTLMVSWIVEWLELLGICLRVLLGAMMARWLLPWPDNRIGYERITLFKIWQAMVLLTFLSRDQSTNMGAAGLVALTAVLSGAALHYGDRGAAMLWLDLLLLWFGAPYLFSCLNAAADFVRLFDAFNVVGFFAGLVGMLLPGKDWWKLVHLYVFWRAYPLRQRVQRNFLVRVGLADKEEAHEV